MSLILIAVVSILGVIISKSFFRKWFNHLSLYCVIMGGLIFFYELKLLPYPNIIPLAWFFIIISFLAFLLGIITVLSARNFNSAVQPFENRTTISLKIFEDNGKALKYSILMFSFIGLFVAIHRWLVLIGKFGSIEDVIINAAVVYRLNVRGEIKEFIPIIPSFIYVGVFLSGIYTAYKGRFSFLSFFPIITIVLKELTYFGRGEMLFSSLEFLFTFILFRHLLSKDSSQRFKFSKSNASVATALMLVLIITAASFIRVSRGSHENYVGTSRGLKQLEKNFIVSPSVYLYVSSDIGVFSKYLELEKEETSFGKNTFRLLYDFLSKLKVTQKPDFFQKGYFIPVWTNTGTFLRELHADFGIAGLSIVPYLLGLLVTWLWFRFYENKSLFVLLFLVYLYLIVGFSFLMMITRLNQWFFSQFLIILYLPFLEKLSSKRKTLILTKQ
jgi:oligosaccharide repeat unit polymerase